MKKRSVFFLVFTFSVLVPALHAQTTSTTQPQPQPSVQFDMSGFPLWAKDLRRAEIIAFGSVPFAYFLTNFSFDVYRFATHGADTRYAPWPFNSAGTVEKTQKQKLMTLGIAAGVAVVTAIVDYAIVRVKRNRLERERANLPDESPIIIRKPLQEGEAGAGDTKAEPFEAETSEAEPLPLAETP